ncbi:MAG: acetyl/propionyl/methylcrotonyl-CoA carboxylase subunit alpha [Alphaproteobacteria bacterium]|nr:acetyl/propionyl/methylcrotonyl-CoA carboxylase subunit alpha [Alphaproteobacteria bacterium]
MPLFKKILIANRGEIACRIMRTAKRLGIATVAVYSEADADARHVREADEAIAIGPAPSAQSYLDVRKIVAACRTSGAQAVHPGYGFLSENPALPRALAKAGITFIGPDPAAMAAMGDKIAAKQIAVKAGVPTVPGDLGVIKDAKGAIAVARRIQYPVMLKAAAGGGGKGMRIATSDAELVEAFQRASGEAKTAFGDARLFLEKFIEEPRHIEIQVLGDRRGNVVHLFERECSIQRRHQKVIEEAPSPFLDAKTRARMGAAAVALAKAAKYSSAGTVEFIVDKQRNFYFLEMNTRLQVEHPVTELVTDLDLVELMIRIAAGEKLPFTQKDLKLSGSAIEARVYAEDPRHGFLPSAGRLVRYAEPAGDGVRVDGGVYEGAEIPIFYDPMIAKVAAYGKRRDAAATRLTQALDGFVVAGIAHNVDFLAAILRNPRFRAGKLSTNFIAREFPAGFDGVKPDRDETELAVLAAAAAQTLATPGSAAQSLCVMIGRDDYPVVARRLPDGVAVTRNRRQQVLRTAWQPGQPAITVQTGKRAATFRVERRGLFWRLARGGASFEAMVVPCYATALLRRLKPKPPPARSRHLLSPMSGLLVSIAIDAGQEVKAGEPLAVVEAMKMENVLRAERDGRIARIVAKPGDSLAVDQLILEFE